MRRPLGPRRREAPARLAAHQAAAAGLGTVAGALHGLHGRGGHVRAGRCPAGPAGPGGPAARTARSSPSTPPGCRARRTPASSPRVPNARGLPGFVATPQNRRSTPSSSWTCFTKSHSPTDTPPDVMTTSYSRAAAMSRRVSSTSSRAMPSSTGSAPASSTWPYAVKLLELRIWPGTERLAHGHQLAARGEDGDARAGAPPRRCSCPTEASRPSLGRAEAGAAARAGRRRRRRPRRRGARWRPASRAR